MKNMEEGNKFGKMVPNTLEALRTTRLMATASSPTLLAISTWALGNVIRPMAKVSSFMLMGQCMTEPGRTTCNMAEVPNFGTTAQNT